jgi:zinc/manganese transport system substrate-binding protein
MRTIIVLAGVALATAGCGGATETTGSALQVVAAENVYGNIAAQIGGKRVSVTSILTDPNADPHLFEPVSRNGLAVSRARLVIRNGAGYDDFLQRLLDSVGGHRVVVNVADVLGVPAGANPHLWYDVPELGRIGNAIAAGLAAADPAHAAAYRVGAARFGASLRPLRRTVATIRARFAGTAVAYTEPVPAYLLAAAGLRNLAPPEYTRAIENGSEPTPQATAAMDALVARRRIAVLLYNSQAVSPLTRSLRAAARAHGVPVVAVSETLPPGLTFQQWQLAQARALERALAA